MKGYIVTIFEKEQQTRRWPECSAEVTMRLARAFEDTAAENGDTVKKRKEGGEIRIEALDGEELVATLVIEEELTVP